MLDRIGKLEGKVEVLTSRLAGVEDWVSESREFHKDMNSFVSSFNAVQTEREKQEEVRHRSNSTKLNLIIAMAAVVSLIIGTATVYVMIKTSEHKSTEIPFKIGTDVQPKVYALEQQPTLSAKE